MNCPGPGDFFFFEDFVLIHVPVSQSRLYLTLIGMLMIIVMVLTSAIMVVQIL